MDTEYIKHTERNVVISTLKQLPRVVVKNLDMDFLRIDIIQCDVNDIFPHCLLY